MTDETPKAPAPHGDLEHCGLCEEVHGPRYLCDPAKALLDQIKASGHEHDKPFRTFDGPLPIDLQSANGDRMLVGFEVKASILAISGTAHPALIFGGTDAATGQPAPALVFPGDIPTIDGAARLVTQAAASAIRAARQENRRPGGSASRG